MKNLLIFPRNVSSLAILVNALELISFDYYLKDWRRFDGYREFGISNSSSDSAFCSSSLSVYLFYLLLLISLLSSLLKSDLEIISLTSSCSVQLSSSSLLFCKSSAAAPYATPKLYSNL